ncbi:hypothetical protein [Cerasicoccus maritimus]|uniref:hypothetical protein n=1 Tax=Cerasicoccus maritimus TaxID=490089 RepID=UPI00285264BC|nr:hypothetical protein [Cerasicoccus maritimus]
MKYALILLLLVGAFGLGWVLNPPATPIQRPGVTASNQVDEAANARWRAKTKHLTERQTAEAIYRGELETSAAERINYLKNYNFRNIELGQRISIEFIVLSLNEQEVLDAIESLGDDRKRHYLRGLLLRRWVDLNPEAARAKFLQNPTDKENATLGHYVISSWAKEDLYGAVAAIQQLPAETRKQRMNTLIYNTMRDDPLKALELQQAYGSGNDYTYKNIFVNLTELDPEVAWTTLSSLTYKPYKRAIEGYFEVLKQNDLPGAFALVDSIKGHDTQNNIRRQLYTEWFKQDSQAALAAIGQERHPDRMLSLWNLPPEKSVEVIEWATASLDGLNQDQIITQAIQQLISQDNEAAEDYIAQLPYGYQYRNAMSQLISHQYDEDPQGAIARVQAMPNGQEKRDYLRSILNKMVQHDWETAKEFYATLDPQTQKDSSYAFVNPAIEEGAEAIIAILEDPTTVEGDEEMQNQLKNNWANQDPWSFFDYLGPQGFADLGDNQQKNYIRNFARQSPAEAAAWLDNVDKERLPDLVDSVSDAWLDHDPYEASIWIADLPKGEARDRAYENLANDIRKSDPAAAFDWATGIGDDSMREKSVRQVLREWKDPELARATLAASDLSPEEIAKLMKYVKDD